jgi:hypothetical protein
MMHLCLNIFNGEVASNLAVLQIASDLGIGWNSTNNLFGGAIDTMLLRDAAGTLALRNGLNAQAFRIYNTTDATNTNYERAGLSWAANVLSIGTEMGGTGVARALRLLTGNIARWSIDAIGHLLAASDNTNDICDDTES